MAAQIPTLPPATPSQIVHIVVLTAAVAFISYFGSLVALEFLKITPDEKVFEALKTAGTSTMSFLFGILVNTRVSPKDSKDATPEPAPKDDKKAEAPPVAA